MAKNASTQAPAPAGGDLFANIASGLSKLARPGLAEPALATVPAVVLPLNSPVAGQPARLVSDKILTAEQLAAALAAERTRTAPFLQNLAPALPSTRQRVTFKETQWRVETPADRQDFTNALVGQGVWEKVSIPHYGPPLGKAFTLYRVTFDLAPAILAQERIVLHFDAVDYVCMPYLNGLCLGKHEGFFEPFEFDITSIARPTGNTLVVRVENDITMLGEAFAEVEVDGDKVYAATGFGYDDPVEGWHHCPAGMGICQPFYIEGRARLAIADIFARPLASLDAVELRIEVDNLGTNPAESVSLLISVCGQNFVQAVHTDYIYHPTTKPVAGFGDLDKEFPDSTPLRMGSGKNYLTLTLPMAEARRWDLDSPWLYQVQVQLRDSADKVLDSASQQFGMRTFIQDENSQPKGKFYLNGREIRLRGANTMGNLDMAVFRENFDQLRDDILLARLTNMNFLRLTQHPVQKAVYEYCDRLGMMLQTDLPLFGSMRHNQLIECVRQASIMEKLVRTHPCNTLVSFINEPFPNGRSRPHRFISRDDMHKFFAMASDAVRLQNPDRVIKCVDGDYDPPAPYGMPDNHCYCGWYLGHGIDLGRLEAGHWLPVKAGWHFGCGEFGAEGLDSYGVMQQYYPQSWKPAAPGAAWTPKIINKSQTMNFHYLWYPTPATAEGWIEASQKHQDWTNRLMTEAFRRLPDMNTFAIHLFIDAWPAGWMKTIMDVNRVPKRGWFTYRDALSPVAVSLRSARTSGFAGETLPIEVWVANDRDEALAGYTLDYEVLAGGKTLARGTAPAQLPRCAPAGQGVINLSLPAVTARTTVTLAVTLLDAAGRPVHDRAIEVETFPAAAVKAAPVSGNVLVLGDQAVGQAFLQGLGLQSAKNTAVEDARHVLVTDLPAYQANAAALSQAVNRGATVVFLPLEPGTHAIGGASLEVRKAGMGPRHFVSCDSNHPTVAGFAREDFKFWFDEAAGYVTPLLTTVLEAPQWTPILLSGDGGWQRPWGSVPVAAEIREGQGIWRVCQVKLTDRLQTNPVAATFTQRLLGVSA
jgi:hypothetical protein